MQNDGRSDSLTTALARARDVTPMRLTRRGRGSSNAHIEELPILETLSERLARNGIVAHDTNHPHSDIYRSLRARVLQRLDRTRARSVGVVSLQGSDDATVTAINLAIAIAMDPTRSALLVDSNMREPSVADIFGVEPELGLEDYLIGSAELEECLIRPDFQAIGILPARQATYQSSELAALPRMAGLQDAFLMSFGPAIVVHVLPPLLDMSDAIEILPHIDGTLLVVRDGASTEDEIEKGLATIGSERYLGTVLTGFLA
ncbi:MAG: CpsD/CapB family tyrosine-protein kinase [Pseudomonadota bacterium]